MPQKVERYCVLFYVYYIGNIIVSHRLEQGKFLVIEISLNKYPVSLAIDLIYDFSEVCGKLESQETSKIRSLFENSPIQHDRCMLGFWSVMEERY